MCLYNPYVFIQISIIHNCFSSIHMCLYIHIYIYIYTHTFCRHLGSSVPGWNWTGLSHFPAATCARSGQPQQQQQQPQQQATAAAAPGGTASGCRHSCSNPRECHGGPAAAAPATTAAAAATGMAGGAARGCRHPCSNPRGSARAHTCNGAGAGECLPLFPVPQSWNQKRQRNVVTQNKGYASCETS